MSQMTSRMSPMSLSQVTAKLSVYAQASFMKAGMSLMAVLIEIWLRDEQLFKSLGSVGVDPAVGQGAVNLAWLARRIQRIDFGYKLTGVGRSGQIQILGSPETGDRASNVIVDTIDFDGVEVDDVRAMLARLHFGKEVRCTAI